MARYRGIIVFWVVFVIFAGITVYFYFQHRVQVQTYALDEEIVYKNNRIKLKEIELINFSRTDPFDRWYLAVVGKLPRRLQLPFLQTCVFFSRPYRFDDKFGRLTVKGMIISPSPETFELSNLTFYVDGLSIEGGGMRTESGSNIIYFEKRFRNCPLDKKSFKLYVTDKDSSIFKSLFIKPVWNTKTYHYFRPWPYVYEFGPEQTMSQFVILLNENNRQKAAAYILPSCRKTFPWSNLEHPFIKNFPRTSFINYEGGYRGFPEVYSLNFKFYEKPQSDSFVITPDTPPVAEQKIFFIESGAGWQIIDASPLKYRVSREINSKRPCLVEHS